MEIARGVLMVLLGLTAIFLILLILIQRGRGGGLAGAFGGMGGQSAFGTKAGDLFTRVTIVTAAIWILLCAASVKIFNAADEHLAADAGGTASQSDTNSGGKTNLPAERVPASGDDEAAKGGSASEKVGAAEKGVPAAPEKTKAPAAPAGTDKAPAGSDKTPAEQN